MSKHLKKLEPFGKNKTPKIIYVLFYLCLFCVVQFSLYYLSQALKIEKGDPFFLLINFATSGFFCVNIFINLENSTQRKIPFLSFISKVSKVAYLLGLIYAFINFATNGSTFI